MKNLKTENIDDKLSNDINLSSPVQSNIIPTNFGKFSQNEVLTFRDTKRSQTGKKVDTNVNDQEFMETNIPKQALSPSIAETIRAIFAAFLWHEGLVHDAIACASFLKFHPLIPKHNVNNYDSMILDKRRESILTKEEKIQQRHSVEIANTSNYLNARPSTLEALNKSGYCCVHYRKQRGKISEHVNLDGDDLQGHAAGLPPALKCLVYVWDELNKDFQGFVTRMTTEKEAKDIFKELAQASKAGFVQPNINDLNDLEYQNVKSSKAKRLIEESSTPVGLSSRAEHIGAWCEMCDMDIYLEYQQQYQQHQLTQHMKSVHPGCGESAKGKGYNSNGVYCEGWAGQCGEEGVGATSWYLLCEKCREKYVKDTKRTVNDNPAQAPLEVPSVANPSKSHPAAKKSKFGVNMSMEFFDVMKENALFLLDLNSHNGGLKAPANNLLPTKNKISNRHSSASEFMSQPNTSNFQQHRLSATILQVIYLKS